MELTSLIDPTKWEGFSCLKPGSRLNHYSIDRNHGEIVWGWKQNTAAVEFQIQEGQLTRLLTHFEL